MNEADKNKHIEAVIDAVDEHRDEILAFAQELVGIQSYPGDEERAVRRVEAMMRHLGYDEVTVDGMGNLIGRVGCGPRVLMLDSHLDTVEVNDAEHWTVEPFSGVIRDGMLYGRGSADMKSAAAASVYAAALAKRVGALEGLTVYVSCSVMEEDCDGENLKYVFEQSGVRPEGVVICEPSSNRIALGHKGKAQMVVGTRGVSAHGAAPERGENAVYRIPEIITRVEQLAGRLLEQDAPRGTLVLSRISSVSESLNAVPYECEIYLDRRLAIGEDEHTVRREMEALVDGTSAEWRFGTLHRRSWTGHEVVYEPVHPPWRIGTDHPLARTCAAGYQAVYGRPPLDAEFTFWNFSTNAVASTALGIPTIGFGPGSPELAHMRDEHCPVEQIIEACRFYAAVIYLF